MKQGRETTYEERVEIVRDCIASRKNYGEMALKYQVSYQQVRSWTLRFEELGEAGLEDRRGRRKKDQIPRTELEQAKIEIEQLKHKLYLAEMECELLKKLNEIERRDASRDEPHPVKRTEKKYKIFSQPGRYVGLWQPEIRVVCSAGNPNFRFCQAAR